MCHANIRPRGTGLTFFDRTKWKQLQIAHKYNQIQVFFPTSVDMYQRIMIAIKRNGISPFSFVLDHPQVERCRAVVTIQSAWRAYGGQIKQVHMKLRWQRAVICVQR
jgi:hypothetical protein